MTQTGTPINWLSLMLSAVVGGLAGYISARVQEYQRNRRRLRALAGALRADAQRIRSELGEPNDRYVESHIYGAVPGPVAIHSWTEKLITDSAEISPRVVEQYMTLERSLQNFNTFRDLLRTDLATIANLEEGGRNAEAEGIAGASTVVEVRRRIKDVREVSEPRHRIVVSSRKQAVAALDEIELLLSSYR